MVFVLRELEKQVKSKTRVLWDKNFMILASSIHERAYCQK
jgi:hypothetical protein